MPGVLEALTFIYLSIQAGSLAGVVAGVGAILSSSGGLIISGLTALGSYLSRPKQPKPEDVQQSVRLVSASRQRHYGRGKFSGPWAFADSSRGEFHKVIALGTGELDAIEEIWVDDKLVQFDGGSAGGAALTAPYNGALRVAVRPGRATELHYSGLATRFPEWDASHRGDGIASLYAVQFPVKSEDFPRIFPNGIHTNYRVVARTSKVLNPVTNAVAWSDNAAAVIRDYATHRDGARMPLSFFNTPLAKAGWAAAFNRCAEPVPLKAGGTESRYRFWGSYSFDERPGDILGRMLQCCDGQLVPTPDGGITLDIGAWEEPTVILDESAIVGFTDLAGGREIMTTANVIKATYLSVPHDYTAQDAQAWEDADDVALRGEIEVGLSFNGAPSHSQCRRLMKIAAHDYSPEWAGTFRCNLRGMAAFAKRFVRIRIAEFDLDAVFKIDDLRFDLGEGNLLRGVIIVAHSVAATVAAWDPATEEGEAPIAETTEIDRTIPVPTGFTFTEERITVNGQAYSVGRISFDAPPSKSLRVDVQYKKVANTTWETVPVADEALSTQTPILSDNVEYEARIRHVTTTGRFSEWTSPTLKLTPVADTVAPKSLSSFTVTGGLGNAALGFATKPDEHLKRIAIYRVPAGGTLNKTTHALPEIGAAPGTTFGFTDGDALTALLINDASLDDPSKWTVTGQFSVTGGQAVKPASANISLLYQPWLTAPVSGDVIRWAVDVASTNDTGGFNLFNRTTPGAGTNTVTIPAGAGVKLGTLAITATETNFGVTAATTRAATINSIRAYKQTGACAPQGVWDYYAEPKNGSGVAGPLSGPITVTVV